MKKYMKGFGLITILMLLVPSVLLSQIGTGRAELDSAGVAALADSSEFWTLESDRKPTGQWTFSDTLQGLTLLDSATVAGIFGVGRVPTSTEVFVIKGAVGDILTVDTDSMVTLSKALTVARDITVVSGDLTLSSGDMTVNGSGNVDIYSKSTNANTKVTVAAQGNGNTVLLVSQGTTYGGAGTIVGISTNDIGIIQFLGTTNSLLRLGTAPFYISNDVAAMVKVTSDSIAEFYGTLLADSIYVTRGLSALNVTDRSKMYMGNNAVALIGAIKGKDKAGDWGKVDHPTLPEGVYVSVAGVEDRYLDPVSLNVLKKKEAFNKAGKDIDIIEVLEFDTTFIETVMSIDTTYISKFKHKLSGKEYDSLEEYTEEKFEKFEIELPGRNLGAMISVNSAAILELLARIEILEAGIEELLRNK